MEGPNRITRTAVSSLIAHPWLVVLAWTMFFLVLTPTALGYTRSINYGQSSGGLSGSESGRADAALAQISPTNSTLFVVIEGSSISPAQLQAETLGFQASLATSKVPYLAGTSSIYSSYSAYLDQLLGPKAPAARSLSANLTALAQSVYGFPAAFLSAWSSAGGTQATINSSFVTAAGLSVGYDEAFRAFLWARYSAVGSPSTQVQGAVEATAPGYFAPPSELTPLLELTNVTAYSGAVPSITAAILSAPGATPVTAFWVEAALLPGDPGQNFVLRFGLSGVPAFLAERYVSPDGRVSLVIVTFSVPESFRASDGTYPAQSATATVRSAADAQFGTLAVVTGQGAAAYDSQQLQGASGALFALIFVVLAIAVALTLRSWIAPILALLLVSLSTLLGYLAIEAASVFVGKIDFTVTYTVTAVTLGIATDYLLFLAYRYREELSRGRSSTDALRVAMERSGFAVIVSAATVAVGLGSLSFLGGLQTWGPTLALTVLLIAFLEVTLLPAIFRLVGPRMFLARWMRPPAPWTRSAFYRAASGSTRRPLLVLGLAAVVAVPAVAGFLFVPTTYDISGVQATGVPSTIGLDELEHSFGANLLYPVYVVTTATGSYLAPNGSLSSEALSTLPNVAKDLLERPGVASVTGPFVSGRNATGATDATSFVLDGGHEAYFLVYSNYAPYSSGALSLVQGLRSNSSYLVGGVTSGVIDRQALNSVEYPAFEVALAILIGLILGISFRSVSVPIISVSGVFLSISVTTSALWLIAQYVLHQPLLYVIPLILFVILMSLGNDYTVFLIARVREEQVNAGPLEGIHRGIAGSGVVVSALGLILAASLGSLALQPLAFLQELGLAFVISLLLDTFLIRPFYFPALLRLLRVENRPAATVLGPGQ